MKTTGSRKNPYENHSEKRCSRKPQKKNRLNPLPPRGSHVGDFLQATYSICATSSLRPAHPQLGLTSRLHTSWTTSNLCLLRAPPLWLACLAGVLPIPRFHVRLECFLFLARRCLCHNNKLASLNWFLLLLFLFFSSFFHLVCFLVVFYFIIYLNFLLCFLFESFFFFYFFILLFGFLFLFIFLLCFY